MKLSNDADGLMDLEQVLNQVIRCSRSIKAIPKTLIRTSVVLALGHGKMNLENSKVLMFRRPPGYHDVTTDPRCSSF